MERIRIARYTDGTLVQEGDRIRYHQAPGGIFAPGDWRYGVAKKYPRTERELESMAAYNERHGVLSLDPDELYLFDGEHHYNIVGHVVEAVSE